MPHRRESRRDLELLLEVRDVTAGYGVGRVLHGVSIDLYQGEIVTLLGRNGMGKTTTVQTIMGNVRCRSGAIHFQGHPIHSWKPYRIAQCGIAIVPEGRRIFGNLTVYENLNVGASDRSGASDLWTLDKVLTGFPQLATRLKSWGSQLSGGEQQMLAIGRALMTNPRLLILDEATEGLAPLIREEIWKCLETLKEKGQSILVIDKNVDRLSRIADYNYVLEKGQVVWAGFSGQLSLDQHMRSRYLSV